MQSPEGEKDINLFPLRRDTFNHHDSISRDKA